MGEIWDEHDEVEEDFRKLEADTYLVDCSVNLDDFLDFFQIKSESDSASLGGWVMEQVGHIPAVGEYFAYDRLPVTVEQTDAHRVTFVEAVAIVPAEGEALLQQ